MGLRLVTSLNVPERRSDATAHFRKPPRLPTGEACTSLRCTRQRVKTQRMQALLRNAFLVANTYLVNLR